MATLQFPGLENNGMSVEAQDIENGFSIQELMMHVGEALKFMEIGDEYLMLLSGKSQDDKVGFNAVATKLGYTACADNVAIYGNILIVEEAEISNELKV